MRGLHRKERNVEDSRKKKKTVLEKWLNFGCSKDSDKLCASPLLFNYLTDTDGRKGRFFFKRTALLHPLQVAFNGLLHTLCCSMCSCRRQGCFEMERRDNPQSRMYLFIYLSIVEKMYFPRGSDSIHIYFFHTSLGIK